MLPLPMDAGLPEVQRSLQTHGAVVVTAAPGAGKSTRVPPAVLLVTNGQVVMLQPRRIAARALAARIAQEQGWTLGKEVGYQVRHERIGNSGTRLWVVTEGILTRRLQDDPLLEGVGAVILDEFHERHVHSDVALAWLQELRRTVRPELRIIVMSATIDPAPVATFLHNAPVVDTPGRNFPVSIHYAPGRDQRRLPERVASAVHSAWEKGAESGAILVFLPGVGEIRACQDALAQLGIPALPLHGQLPAEEQDAALCPGPAPRVVLATNVAETSLTIPDVRTVIDSGEHRINRFDADTGHDTLHLQGIPGFSAEQRAGRAGRTGPGTCIRLWSRAEDRDRPLALEPEIHRVDLAPLLLFLAACGERDPAAFPWFTAPAAESLTIAGKLVRGLGLLTEEGVLTNAGRAAMAMPIHPRWATLLINAQAQGVGWLGATLASIGAGRDLALRQGPGTAPSDSDALDDIERLERAISQHFRPSLRDEGIDPNAAREAARTRDELLRLFPRQPSPQSVAHIDLGMCGKLLLTAWPDRIGKRTSKDGNRVAIVGGIAAEIDEQSALFARPGRPRGELVLAYRLQGVERRRSLTTSVLVRGASELDPAWIEPLLQKRTSTSWNAQRGVVDALVGWWYEDLNVRTVVGEGEPLVISAALAKAIEPEWPAQLAETQPEAAAFVARLTWLRLTRPDLDLPDPMDKMPALLQDLCHGKRSRAELFKSPWLPWMLSWLPRPTFVDEYAPATVTVPTGNHITLDYSDPTRPPILAVRLQELFGLTATPTVNDGRTPVLLHLLAPNYRIEQVTSDLPGFWDRTYPTVRKDLRGRYPRHHWPDDPRTAIPTDRAKRRVVT